MIVEELRAEPYNSVLFYKPAGRQLKYGNESLMGRHHSYKELFLLGLQTKAQKEMLLEYGWKVMCSDSTHDVTQYGHKLISVVVKDKFGEGYTVASCVTNFEDEVVFTVFFQAIRDRVPDLDARCSMSDDSTALKNAVRKVFGERIRVLSCNWHTTLAWNNNANKIATKEERLEVIYLLRKALRDQNEESFNQTINCLFVGYSHCEKFINYFSSTYLNRIDEWAAHMRTFFHDDVETNMLCEALHNLLKTVFMLRYPQRRLDQLINTLLEMEHRRFKEYKVKESINNDSSQKREPSARHRRGLKIPDSSVTEVEPGKWTVVSATEATVLYDVHQYRSDCPEDHCFSVCMEVQCFGLCGHLYSCSCDDNAALCKHRHKVHSYINRGIISKVKKIWLIC